MELQTSVFAPKYRRQVKYDKLRIEIGKILSGLCDRKEVEILEAGCCPDHIHMLVFIPPKMRVSALRGVSVGLEFPDDIRQVCKSEVQIWE